MAYMITAECINCNACMMDCPVSAIAPGPSRYLIDAAVCIECDGYYPIPRCQAACPVAACVPARDAYLKRAANLAARGRPPQRLAATRNRTASPRPGQTGHA